jgi:hypothetical protein
MSPSADMPHETVSWTVSDAIVGLAELWGQTRGDPEVRIAVLDGPVNRAHPSLRGANLVQRSTLLGRGNDRHGTQVASVIFGRPHSSLLGIAPGCSGVVLPIFRSSGACSQLDLARAILQAIQEGAHWINISGGQFVPAGGAEQLLVDAVRQCARAGIVIVAAAGNQGCECLQVPAAIDSVLAVGAMGLNGEPLASSNWGGPYQHQGVLALGEDVPVAEPGGSVARRTGTSFATAIVTGIAALLTSLQRRRGQRPSPPAVREALLQSAIGCAIQPATDCRRLLAGRLNVHGAVSILDRGRPSMSEPMTVSSDAPSPAAQSAAPAPPAAAPAPPLSNSAVLPSAAAGTSCSCQGAAPMQRVYALGQIGYDFTSEARLDSLVQEMAGLAGVTVAERVMAFNPQQLLQHLERHPYYASSLEWTLVLDGTPIYAIQPMGPFATEAYNLLRRFLNERLVEGVERVSVPGTIVGKTTLLMGQEVPVIVPEMRGMFSWTTRALMDAVLGAAPDPNAPQDQRDNYERRRGSFQNFLHRVYHELRNLGMLPQERALNFAATNAFSAARAFENALRERMELESVNVVRSPVVRPNSDCWDVEVYFFHPERQVQTVRLVYRFTVDVSDVVPVTVGQPRSWFTR